MDLNALQTTLREFAAEREWAPFHTPKNLAMALMVEAAELAEVFQWMTPEQSQSARSDTLLQERVSDELADVLLYLVQIADHTGIDLKRAVGRKLVKNSKKHPPLRPGLPGVNRRAVAAADTRTHVLVDWENVQPGEADIRSLVPEVTDVWLFHGPNQKAVSAKHASFGEKATPVKIARTGKNALDFHLSFYMGYIAARHPEARFVVVSNDKGYGPMLEHAAELGFSARQVGFGKVGAAVGSVPTSLAKAAPAKQTAAKKVAAKKPVAKPPSSPAAKAPPKKEPPAKQAAPTKGNGRAMGTPTVAADAPMSGAVLAAAGSSVIDLKKAVRHVVASLAKMTGKPSRRAKLLATIGSLLGPSADEQVLHSVLAQLLASGALAIDPQGGVRYALPSA